mmetsp:Transcript_23742/g.3947  ORF Transcript_23742/g.3947 Transcript_23742/m.3947 type:complete len:91 (+) Transcript_23742:526-798(+)
MSIVGCCVTGIFIYKASTSSSFFGPISGAILNAIQIRVMNIVYELIAKKLNDWENHETELDYTNNLSVKLFLFKFVNSYISLFYICFLKQ